MGVEHSRARRPGQAARLDGEEDWKTTLEITKGAGLAGDRPVSSYYRNLVQQQ